MHRKQKQLWGWDNVITKELPQFARLRELPRGSTEGFTSVSPEPSGWGWVTVQTQETRDGFNSSVNTKHEGPERGGFRAGRKTEGAG